MRGTTGLPTVVAGSDDGGAPVDGSLRGVAARAGAVVALVCVVVLAAALAGPWDPELGPAPTESAAPPVSPPPQPTQRPLPELPELPPTEPWSGATALWLGLATLVAGGLLYLVVRLLRRWRLTSTGRRQESAPDGAGVARGDMVAGLLEPDLPAMREGVAGAGEHLRSRLAPGDAVIAAWVALEDAAGRSGIPRHPASTPTEFTLDVLDRTPADRDATRTLLDLYLRARFGHEALTHHDVAAASAAVERLAADLTRPRARADEEPGGPVTDGRGPVPDDGAGPAPDDGPGPAPDDGPREDA